MKSADETADGLEDTLVDDFMGHPDPALMAHGGTAAARRSPLYRPTTWSIPTTWQIAASAPETLAWMGGHGMRFDVMPTPFLTTSTTRMAPVGGGLAIIETMGKAAPGLGVEFPLRDPRARSLVTGDTGSRGSSRTRPPALATFRG